MLFEITTVPWHAHLYEPGLCLHHHNQFHELLHLYKEKKKAIVLGVLLFEISIKKNLVIFMTCFPLLTMNSFFDL